MNRARVVILLAAIGVIALAFSAVSRELSFHLLFGWWAYLERVLPKVTVRWDGVALFLFGLAAFTVLMHRIATWLRWEMTAHTAIWRWRSTLLLVGAVVMMFVAGIAIVGVAHQLVWLAADDVPSLRPALKNRPDAGRDDLKIVGSAVHSFYDVHRRFPTLPPIPSDQPEHSWVTQILPFLSLTSDIDLEKPWDHVDNRPHIRKLVPVLLNSGLRVPVLRDANGYGVSHYAGNRHLFEKSGQLSFGIFASARPIC